MQGRKMNSAQSIVAGAVLLVLTCADTAIAQKAGLVNLAEEHVGRLSPGEQRLVMAAAAGQEFDAAHLDGSDRSAEPLRAAVLSWLCTDPSATAALSRRGISVRQATFTGALQLRYAKLATPLSLQDCTLEAVDVSDAELVALTLDGSTVRSFRGDQLRVERDLSLKRGFTCAGDFRLPFAWIEGHLDLSSAKLLNESSDALLGDGCRVDGDVRLRHGFTAVQRVSLANVRIAGSLACDNGHFHHADDIALYLPGSRISGDWTLHEAEVNGGVVCHGASITGDVDADRSRLSFPQGVAFRGYALEVGGDLRFVDATLSGDILLEAAEIGRDLNFADARFDTADPPVHVLLQGLTATRRFRWTGVQFRPEVPVELDLRSASAGVLYDDVQSWPAPGNLRLQGFDYTEIHDDAPFDAPSRIDWLRRQHTQRFRAQPYEQLADIFRKGGQAAAARDVLIAKEADRANQSTLSAGEWLWYRVFGPMIGYGYEPGRAFAWMIAVVLLGAAFFQIGYWRGWMTPMKVVEFVSAAEGAQPYLSPDYPKFNAIVYSLDVFTPLTYLHQADYWVANPQRGERLPLLFWSPTPGELLRIYSWIHVIAGWTLTFLLIAGLSGLVQH
jgi:hypothetical protein